MISEDQSEVTVKTGEAPRQAGLSVFYVLQLVRSEVCAECSALVSALVCSR